MKGVSRLQRGIVLGHFHLVTTALDSCLRPSLADTVEECTGGDGGTKCHGQGRWAATSGETHAAEKVPHPGDFSL